MTISKPIRETSAVAPAVAGGVIETIAAQAAAQPDALAVGSAEAPVTFRQLEERSNRLARLLQSRGVGCETPVGLYTGRSPEFVIGALAILKAGGAYVPLDPAAPRLRIASILRDCQSPLLLSHRWMAANLPSGPWANVDVDVDAAAIQSCSASPVESTRQSDSLAYVIYTSGSTGAPKGVEITHGNLAHLMNWHRRAYRVTARDRASQLAGLGFDAAVWELWCNLGAGASVHLIDDASRLSAEGLQAWLLRHEITLAFAPTLMAERLIELEWPAATPLRVLLTGADTLRRYPKHGLPFDLVNHYGPTECTVLVSAGLVPVEPRTDLPTLGRPIEDMELRILDANLEPVAAGEAGELCVAGPQVARGYRGDPAATAQKFVTSSDAPGWRFYRTGDRARFLPNGELAFLGRIDRQLKIRGYRVEPDEIAAHLNRHADVRSSIVVARADGPGEPVLTAYLATAPGVRLTAAELRRHLTPHLAPYMLPDRFVAVDALPINANGKCDLEALPAPNPDNLLPEDDTVASQTVAVTATQSRLLAMVSGLIGHSEIRPSDNFFLIGGHSLLAAQLVAKVQDQFGVRLSLRQLFEAPTVEALAAAIDRAPLGTAR